MCAVEAVPHADLVSFGNLIFDMEMQVRERGALGLDELSILIWSVELPSRIVPHEVRREQFVDPGEIAAMPDLFPYPVG